MAELKARLGHVAPTCGSYPLGQAELSPDRDIWVALAGNKAVKAICVERIFLVPVL